MDYLEFLEAIYGDASGWVSVVNRDPNNWSQVNSEHWRRWPENKQYLAKYCSLRGMESVYPEDTYVSVALFTHDKRTKDDAGAVAHTVWADADTCNPDNFRAYPSIVVQTSPNRWHCWWVLDEPVLASEAAKTSQRIAYAHRDQGCDLGWFASKILRVPGTPNLKDPENPFVVTATYTGQVYTLEQLNELYADQTPSAPVVLSDEMPEFLSYSERAELENRIVKNSPYESLYMTRPDANSDWSDKLFRLQFDLFREGCSAREVFTLSKHAACNKFDRDNRANADATLWKTVQNAYRKFVAETEGLPGVVVEAKKQWTIPSFLSEVERLALPETFIDRYVAWVAERTDAAQTYSRSLAYMLLSCVFGNRGYLPDSYGKRFLNLWMIISGPTTATRKTTARNLAIDILHGFELNSLGGERVDIGSDVTKEGLGKVLGERDGLVSLVQADEVSGMFRELYGKTYQHGTIEYFTDLYDGRVPVVLRAGKDAGQTKRARTVFNFLGLGVPEKITEVLTRGDFESGFLTRMLWSVADAPPRKAGSEDWPEEISNFDESESVKWVFDLKRRAAKFNPEKPVAVRVSSKARTRYGVWAELVRSHAEGYGDSVLEASVSRFQQSVRKAAALLAMYDGSEVIEIHHLLPAIAQAELWYGDLLRMLSEVSASGFEKLQTDVEGFISQGTGGIRPDAVVRQKFKHLRPQEFSDVLTTLIKQGRVRNIGEAQLQVLA